MAYNNDCVASQKNCTRLQYWSNPGVNYPIGNDPMGVASGAQPTDNHRTLNNTALTVANFRCSSPGVLHVWARDTWDDTGAEPDPHTAGEPMWESPYIWVRNAQDAALIYQHEHQNPIYGQPNWIYTKLHNGLASTTSGNLEIYYADASTSLQWPAGWHLIQSVPVTGFTSHSTRIVEAQWSTLPGKGHFCLLARWNSPSDPLTNAETADIDHNVRYNNKLVWHNVNIVDLGSSDHAEAVVNVRNLRNRVAPVTLQIVTPRGEPNFLQQGHIRLQFDPRLLALWRKGGTKGEGFGDTKLQWFDVPIGGAKFENILLKPKASGQLKLTFSRPANMSNQVFTVRVVQLQPAAASLTRETTLPLKAEVVGGVTYEIHTEPAQK